MKRVKTVSAAGVFVKAEITIKVEGNLGRESINDIAEQLASDAMRSLSIAKNISAPLSTVKVR